MVTSCHPTARRGAHRETHTATQHNTLRHTRRTRSEGADRETRTNDEQNNEHETHWNGMIVRGDLQTPCDPAPPFPRPMSGYTQQTQRRAERPPSAGPGGRSQGRGGSREFAPDPQAPSQPYLFYSDVPPASQGGMQQPTTGRAHSLGGGSGSGSGVGGGVKLPAAGNYTAPAPKNDGQVGDLRTALSREIEYRRHLEGEVSLLKESVSRVLAAQQRAALAAEFEPDDASTVVTQPQQPRGARPRSSNRSRHHGERGDRDRDRDRERGERVHGSPGGSPTSSPPHSASGSAAFAAGFPLAPVLPVSAKVAQLEERMAEAGAAEANRAAEAGQRIAELMVSIEQLKADHAASLADSRAAVSALEARLLSDSKTRDRDQTSLHETHASSLRALTSMVQSLQSSLDHPPPSSLVATLQAQVLDHRNQLSALSTLTTSSTPRLIEKLTASCDANAAAWAKLTTSQADSTAALAKRIESVLASQESLSASVRALQAQLDASASSGLQSRLQSQCDSTLARLHKLEDTVRTLPTPDPQTTPRINHLYIAMDRLESQMETVIGGKGGASTKRGSAAPPTPSSASPAAAAKTAELEDQMRLIRGAISQVDAKITESNTLNASMHERMNTLDSGVAAGKKNMADLATRLKMQAQAQREHTDRIEAIATAQAALEARVTKGETEARARETREREKRKQAEAAKDDSTAAAFSGTAAGAAIASAPVSSATSSASDPSDADTSVAGSLSGGAVADPLRALVDDRIRRERRKVKTMYRSLEVAATESTAALTALTARVEAMEASRKKAQAAEEKRRAAAEEEAARSAAALADKLGSAVADLQSHSQSLSSIQSAAQALEAKLAARLEEIHTAATGDRLELQNMLDAHMKRLTTVETAVAAATASHGSGGQSESLSAAVHSSVSAAVHSLRTDLDAVITRSTQSWSLVSECNRVVSKLEANVTQLQLKMDEAAANATAAPAAAAPPAGLDPSIAAELDAHRSRLSSLLVEFDQKSTEQSAFATQVSELRMRHDQLRREMELQENKLASQMAATTYLQQESVRGRHAARGADGTALACMPDCGVGSFSHFAPCCSFASLCTQFVSRRLACAVRAARSSHPRRPQRCRRHS